MASPFLSLGLRPEFVQAVEQLGYETPTPIQLQAIPALIKGRDMVGQAQTGTGKTAAYALPMLQNIQPGDGVIQALVLAPTRELAIQVAEATSRMAQTSPVRVMAVYGGQSYEVQLRQIRRGVDVVVGTPGRLLDLMRSKRIDLSQVRYLVLDEADEMLEMGFIEDVEEILKALPVGRQVALFSATMPTPVRRLAERYLNNPVEISINPTHITVAETEQRCYRVREEQKVQALIRLLETEDVKSALIFVRTKARAQEIADELFALGYPAESLHGDLNQSRREFVLNRFRQGAISVLVATDVAARGLDIEDISHVFNFDIPEDPDDYVHRIGRTGRAGRKGIAITFLISRDVRRIKQIEAFTRTTIKECHLPTRNDILARRDERFMQKLTELLGQGNISRERALLARLEGTSFDIVEIAAAAMQLARGGEPSLPAEEIIQPTAERRGERNERPYEHREHRSAGRDSGKPTGKPTGKYPHTGKSERSDRPVVGAHTPRPHESGMVRLWMNLGDSHGLRPGDVVGAIASEVGIPGKAIGEIDIRDDFTFVDVSEQHVQQVLRQSEGKYFLRGKPVMIRLAS